MNTFAKKRGTAEAMSAAEFNASLPDFARDAALLTKAGFRLHTEGNTGPRLSSPIETPALSAAINAGLCLATGDEYRLTRKGRRALSDELVRRSHHGPALLRPLSEVSRSIRDERDNAGWLQTRHPRPLMPRTSSPGVDDFAMSVAAAAFETFVAERELLLALGFSTARATVGTPGTWHAWQAKAARQLGLVKGRFALCSRSMFGLGRHIDLTDAGRAALGRKWDSVHQRTA